MRGRRGAGGKRGTPGGKSLRPPIILSIATRHRCALWPPALLPLLLLLAPTPPPSPEDSPPSRSSAIYSSIFLDIITANSRVVADLARLGSSRIGRNECEDSNSGSAVARGTFEGGDHRHRNLGARRERPNPFPLPPYTSSGHEGLRCFLPRTCLSPGRSLQVAGSGSGGTLSAHPYPLAASRDSCVVRACPDLLPLPYAYRTCFLPSSRAGPCQKKPCPLKRSLQTSTRLGWLTLRARQTWSPPTPAMAAPPRVASICWSSTLPTSPRPRASRSSTTSVSAGPDKSGGLSECVEWVGAWSGSGG